LGRVLVGILYVDGIRWVYNEAIEIPTKKTREFYANNIHSLSPKLNDTFFGLADYSGIDGTTTIF
jgi:hypothetical protein